MIENLSKIVANTGRQIVPTIQTKYLTFKLSNTDYNVNEYASTSTMD